MAHTSDKHNTDKTRVLVLNFHGVGRPSVHIGGEELPYWWDEGPFEDFLSRVSASGCREIPDIKITFDDGNTSDVDIVVPLLLKFKLVATFFLCAGRVGRRGYVDDVGINAMLDSGMIVGSHGMNHRDWRRLSATDLDEEIGGARRKLEDLCGREINLVSIPFGLYNRRVLGRLRCEKFRHVYTSDRGLGHARDWLIPRETLDRTWQGRDPIAELARPLTFRSKLKRTSSMWLKRVL